MLVTIGAPVFDVRELTKIYRMGEVEIHALRQVSLVLHEGHFISAYARKDSPPRGRRVSLSAADGWGTLGIALALRVGPRGVDVRIQGKDM